MMVFVICQRLVIRHQIMVLEMMTNSWERGEATDSLCGFIWLNLDEDEAVKGFYSNFPSLENFKDQLERKHFSQENRS